MATLRSDFQRRLRTFVELVGQGLRSDTQRAAFARYVVGLLSDAERKSIEPLAARSCPDRCDAEHQALLYFVAEAPWRDHAVRRAAATWALWAATAAGPVRRTIIDDTGLLKSGDHSVGVAHQYTGSAGKQTNCQVAVTLAVATDHDTVPIDVALYLPQTWAFDATRRAKAKIPDAILFQPKWEIALDLLTQAARDGVPLGDVVQADADYGRSAAFRRTITALGRWYAVGVYSSQHVFYRGREWTAADLAAAIRADRYVRHTWRTGARGTPLTARFALRRVRVANEEGGDHAAGRAQWLVVEWRDGEAEPAHFHLATFPADWPHDRIVGEIKERWRTERMNEDLKGEVGFDHYEGRGWIGWNHHMSVVLCAYALLLGERLVAFPPSASRDAAVGAHDRAA